MQDHEARRHLGPGISHGEDVDGESGETCAKGGQGKAGLCEPQSEKVARKKASDRGHYSSRRVANRAVIECKLISYRNNASNGRI